MKKIDTRKPADLPPVDLKPIKPTRVKIKKPPPPRVNVTVREAMGAWWQYWWHGKALDALEGRPADLLPSVGKIHSLVKWGGIIIAILIGGGFLAWVIFKFWPLLTH